MGTMPAECNALVRLDKDLDYCKVNCQWGFVRQGRPRSGVKKPEGKITKRKRIKNPKTLCVTLEQKHYDYIVKQALLKSAETGEIVQPNELIREALVKAFPSPELYDLFGGKKK